MKKSRFSISISFYPGNDKETAIVTVEDKYEFVCDLSNGAIYNDLEWPLAQTAKARHYLRLYVSETEQDRET